MPINAYAAMQAKQFLKPFTYEPKALGAYEVEVKISQFSSIGGGIRIA